MPRPLFRCSAKDLEDLFKEKGHDASVLNLLMEELGHRSTGRALNLLASVKARLVAPGPQNDHAAAVRVAAPVSNSRDPVKVEPPEEVDGVFDEDAPNEPEPRTTRAGRANDGFSPNDLEMPAVLTKMRPVGTAGLPNPYVRQRANDVALNVQSVDIVDHYIAALAALILEMKKAGAGQRRYELENGVRIAEAALDETRYLFEFTDEADLFEDAKVVIEVEGRRCDGTIVSISEGKLQISIERDFGPQLSRAVLIVDATALLEALKSKLEEVKAGSLQLNRKLADAAVNSAADPDDPEPIPVSVSEGNLDASKQNARSEALQRAVTRIWGPPGTGKTYLIGEIVRSVFEAGKRILICSNTNKAVDQAILSICERLGREHPALEDGLILRIGKIASQKLDAEYHDYVTVDGVVKRRSKELYEQKRALEAEVAAIDQATAGIVHVIELFAALDRATKAVRVEEEKTRLIVDKKIAIAAKIRSAGERIATLEAELLSRKGALFKIFRRSEEIIVREIAKATAEKTQHEKDVQLIEVKYSEAMYGCSDLKKKYAECQRAVVGQDRKKAEEQLAKSNRSREALVERLREIDSKLSELRNEVLRRAMIVGATCTKAYLSIKEFGRFGMVIIDEASMVIPPMIWIAAGLSDERVVVCGDRSQIPPIVPTDQEAIFQILGMDVLSSYAGEPPMLEEQYRMAEEICDLIKKPMYKGLLRTSSNKVPDDVEYHVREPFGSTLTVVDTSDLWPFETVNAFGSRFNLMHSLLVRNLAWYLNGVEKCPEIGVCTPYAAESRLIAKLLKSEGLDATVHVGTVHRYQGDEKDMMILDIPEGHGGGWGLGQFVQGVPPDHVGARLLNVAVSRAKRNLVIIANVTYLDKRLPSHALLREFLWKMQKVGRTISGKQLLSMRPMESDLKGLLQGKIDIDPEVHEFGLFNEKNFDKAFMFDLMNASTSILVFSGFITPQRVSELGEMFRVKINEGVKIRCVTRPPHLNGSMALELGQAALDALEGIGCVVDCRAKIHQKAVVIDSDIVWHGSLNVLSNSHRTEESMTRIVNSDFAQAVVADMCKRRISSKQASAAAGTAENPRCATCGSRTVYAQGRFGAYYYCENKHTDVGCDWSSNMAQVERRRR